MKIRKKIERRKIRGYMRGYRLLKKADNLILISKIKYDISHVKILDNESRLTRLFFFEAKKNADLSIRQFLTNRVNTTTFNKAVLYAYGTNKNMVFPLPKAWQDVIEKNGIPLCRKRCSILWAGVVCLYWLRGARIFGSYLFKYFKRVIYSENFQHGKYSYFDNLSIENLPKKTIASYDVISWYLRWGERCNSINSISHDVNIDQPTSLQDICIKYKDHNVLFTTRPIVFFRFLILGLGFIGISGILVIFGRWQNAILLGEHIKAIAVKLSNSSMLARDYMFHNSKWIYRPLWTYEAERKGSNIIFYFYSTNSEPFKTNCGYQKQFNHWDLMSWPKYLVWDSYQKNWLIRSLGSDINIKIVGPIWFSSNNKKSTALPLNTIAVFDIPARRDCLYQSHAHLQNYWTPSIVNQFLVDICHVFLDTKVNIAYKQKRVIGDDIHPSYEKIINKIHSNKKIIQIDPDVSAIDVINKSKYVISLPFTSTAIIGKNMGIESVYYDPTSMLQKDDRAAHGILVLSGINELERWATRLLTVT